MRSLPFAHPRVAATLLVLLGGVSALPAQIVTEGNLDLRQIDFSDDEASGDRFGDVLATGDFDCDGRDDLAIGAPAEDVDAVPDAGAVFVTYGSVFGLGLGPFDVFHQNSPGMLDSAQAFDGFGSALAAGDIDDDGCDDLAIGVPGQDLTGGNNAGAVHVLYGSGGGLTADDDEIVSQGVWIGLGNDEADDAFGSALAFGDFDGDDRADLAIGAPGEDADTGVVAVVFGGINGLSISGELLENFDPIDGEAFGTSLAAGRSHNGATDNLMIGVPGYEIDDRGALVFLATAEGVGFTGNASLVSYAGYGADTGGGTNVVAGSFDGLGSADYASGVPRSGDDNEGAVCLTVNKVHCGVTLEQGVGGIMELKEPFDQIGQALAIGDFNGDLRSDLVIGVPGENLYDGLPGQLLDAGLIHVLYGSEAGLTTVGDQLFTLDTPGIDYGASANDRFGSALAAGDFDGDGADELAIGIPQADLGASNTGLVLILRGSSLLFADGFESGNTLDWSSSTP